MGTADGSTRRRCRDNCGLRPGRSRCSSPPVYLPLLLRSNPFAACCWLGAGDPMARSPAQPRRLAYSRHLPRPPAFPRLRGRIRLFLLQEDAPPTAAAATRAAEDPHPLTTTTIVYV